MKSSIIPAAPEGYNTVDSFIITKDALKLIAFLEKVFGAEEVKEAHTVDDDGLLLHSELKIGSSVVMIADRKVGWPFTPSLLRVYVDDVEQALQTAKKLGAKIVTEPTDFYGDKLSRFQDPWSNLWWVYEHGKEVSWEATIDGTSDEAWVSEPTKELMYIHDTLMDVMKKLGR